MAFRAEVVGVVVLALPPPLTAGTGLTSWQLEPAVLAVLVLAAAAYLYGLSRLHKRGQHWPLGRTLTFLVLGLGSLLLAGLGWIGVYAHVLMWVFTVQILVLLLVTPAFLALGRPFELMRAAAGRTDAPVGRLVRTLDNPLLGPALIPVLTGMIFFTPLLDASLRHPVVGSLLRLGLVLAGLIFALPLIGGGVSRAPLAIAVATFVGFFELLADAIPGIALRLQPQPISGVFTGLQRGWGPSALADQHTAGSILWVVAEVVDLPFLALLVLQWIRADAREAALVDARLDAAAVAPGPGERAPSGPDDDPAAERGRVRPWWETDGSVFGAERAARYRPGRPGSG
jgi:putative membrane protein